MISSLSAPTFALSLLLILPSLHYSCYCLWPLPVWPPLVCIKAAIGSNLTASSLQKTSPPQIQQLHHGYPAQLWTAESPHATAVYPVSLHVSAVSSAPPWWAPVSLAPHGPGPPFSPPVPPPSWIVPCVWSVWKPLFGGGALSRIWLPLTTLQLHITHGLQLPSFTALQHTHSHPTLHQSHSCH